MKASEAIKCLQLIVDSTGDQECYLEYDGSVIPMDSIEYKCVLPERDVFMEEYRPKDGIYSGVFFNEHETLDLEE